MSSVPAPAARLTVSPSVPADQQVSPFAFFLLMVAFIRRVFLPSRNNAPTFTVDTAAILTNASAIFTAFSALLAVIIGYNFGLRLLERIRNMF